MKEYWVNVYDKWPYIWIKSCKWPSQLEAETLAKMMLGIKRNYRLHVREFETREAKELYLKMKYGKSQLSKYQHEYSWQHPVSIGD